MAPGIEEYDDDILFKKRPPFDFNRLGARKKNPTNCSLALKKVPISLNNIVCLNNHFSNFGKIVNIKCGYKGDPKAATITFSGHAEANAAYRNTVILNNRFIKVYSHSNGKQEKVLRPSANERLRKNAALNLNKVLNLVEPKAEVGGPQTQKNFAAVSNEKKADTKKSLEMLAAIAKHKKSQGEALKVSQNLSTLQQALLQKQLGQQKLLISKMEKAPAGPQREYLLRMIKKFQKSTEPVRKVIVAQPITSTMATSPQRTKKETQKDRLDAEIDLITEQLKRMHLTSSEPSKRTYNPIGHHLLTNTNAIKPGLETDLKILPSDFESDERERVLLQFSASRIMTWLNNAPFDNQFSGISNTGTVLASESDEDDLADEEVSDESDDLKSATSDDDNDDEEEVEEKRWWYY